MLSLSQSPTRPCSNRIALRKTIKNISYCSIVLPGPTATSLASAPRTPSTAKFWRAGSGRLYYFTVLRWRWRIVHCALWRHHVVGSHATILHLLIWHGRLLCSCVGRELVWVIVINHPVGFVCHGPWLRTCFWRWSRGCRGWCRRDIRIVLGLCWRRCLLWGPLWIVVHVAGVALLWIIHLLLGNLLHHVGRGHGWSHLWRIRSLWVRLEWLRMDGTLRYV